MVNEFKIMEYQEFLKLAKASIRNCIQVGGGSYVTYKKCVETFMKDSYPIAQQYDLTESELFVMFMMVIKNYSEIQDQFITRTVNQFTKECASLFDSFLQKIPRSASSVFYRVDKYQRIGNFINKSTYQCEHYLTASTSQSIFDKLGNGVKFIITKRLIGETKAREVFRIYNANNEHQINFERNVRFRIDGVDKKNKTVFLTEM